MNVYAAMALKGRKKDKTIRIEAKTLREAKQKASEELGAKTKDIVIQLQRTADGKEVIGYIM